MNKTALELTYDLINLSRELEDLNTQKATEQNTEIDIALDTRIGAKEFEFFRIREILSKINI